MDQAGKRAGSPQGAAADSAELPSSLTAHHLQAILDAVREPIVLTRLRDGMTVYANPAYDELMGFGRGEIVGRTIDDLDFYVGPQARREMIRRLIKEKSVDRWESIVRTKAGELRHHWNSSTSLMLDGVEHFVTTVFDQDDERARLHDVTVETEARWREVLDAAPTVFSVKDLNGRHIYANRRLHETVGVGLDGILGHSAAEIFEPETAEQMLAADSRALATGEPVQFETVIRDAAGVLHTFLALTFPLRHGSADPVSLCTMATEVTEERNTQAALRETQVRFRQLAESVDDVFVLTSGDLKEILYITPNVARLMGLAADDTSTGLSGYLDMVHPDDAEVVNAAMQSVMAGGESVVDYRIIRADGSLRWIRSRTSAIHQDGTSTRHAITLTDITADREIERELLVAREAAETANRRKNEFLSRMSHELRTPLNAILGFSQLLEMDVATLLPEQAESLSHINGAGRHLLALINEVLDIARIESGELRLSVEDIDVGSVVDEVIEMVRSLAASRRVELDADNGDRPAVAVRADRQRLKQVLINLLSNAVKYNRRGGEIVLRYESTASGHVRISVSDTGIGIAQVDLQRLFTPFERLGNAVDVEGTGIGLALTRQLVEAMNGTIAVASVVGRGSCFTVELQAGEPNRRPPKTIVGGGRPAASGNSLIGPLRTVLYVEDNPANVELVQQTLARWPQLRLIVATHGHQALELVRGERPDLVLLDLHLPDILGDEVLRELRADPATEDLPVIVVSADATPARVKRLLAQGANHYLAKPFELNQLIELVVSALAGPTSTQRS